MSKNPEEKVVRKTTSLCPECLAKLEADIIERDGKIYMRKTCKEHGECEELYWGDAGLYHNAERFAKDGRGIKNPQITKSNPNCPDDCGLCNIHESHSALANIVLTNRCDLNCWYCFFFAEKAGYVYEPSLEEIKKMLEPLRDERPIPCAALQITGGEPTLRRDLIDIIREIRAMGFEHIQLNTDGINLANDPELAAKVRDAGVNTIYLSYDGTDEKTNPKNHWEIPKVLENCRRANLGIVLVPTVIRTVNDDQPGKIVQFAMDNIDIIRGVNFQPVSLVGRVPKHEREKFRITIPDVLKVLEKQTNGALKASDFYTVPSVVPLSQFIEQMTGEPQYDLTTHFACGSATYIFKEDGKIIPITRFVNFEALYDFLDSETQKMKKGRSKYISAGKMLLKLGEFIDAKKQPKGMNLAKMIYEIIIKHNYGILGEFHHNALFIGMMHFQDLYNWDLERTKKCCVHYATPEGIIPFCTFNVIPQWYRDKIQRAHGIPIGEWEKRTGRALKQDLYIRKK